METLQQLLMGFHVAVTPINLLLCFLGALAGTIIVVRESGCTRYSASEKSSPLRPFGTPPLFS